MYIRRDTTKTAHRTTCLVRTPVKYIGGPGRELSVLNYTNKICIFPIKQNPQPCNLVCVRITVSKVWTVCDDNFGHNESGSKSVTFTFYEHIMRGKSIRLQQTLLLITHTYYLSIVCIHLRMYYPASRYSTCTCILLCWQVKYEKWLCVRARTPSLGLWQNRTEQMLYFRHSLDKCYNMWAYTCRGKHKSQNIITKP